MAAKYLFSRSYNVYNKTEVRTFLIGNALTNVLLSCLWCDTGSIKSKGTAMQIVLLTLSGCYAFTALTNNPQVLKANLTFILGLNILANVVSAKRAHIHDWGSLLAGIATTSAYGMIYSTM